ncbi:MAG: CHAD domain-containing protein [Rubrobacteraceae bacterium]
MQNLTSDQQEVEWQFDALDTRPVRDWLGNRSSDEDPRVGEGETREITDTYFDTGDWRIYRAGYSLRVRRKGSARKREATMKLLASPDGAPGLRRRREISEQIESVDDLTAAPGPIGERLRALAGSRKLESIFEVRTRRGAYEISLEGNNVGEVALDDTEIPLENGEEPARLRRVEVELDPGALDTLDSFVQELRESCRLWPATASKYEAALFARGLTPPEPPDFGPTGVDASLAIGEVAFAVMREQFGTFLAHEPGTRLGEDSEALHDMRVASRRMRAAMQIFKDALPVRSRKLRDELKWIAGVLGEVRDLDVQLEQLEDWLSESSPEDREPLGELRGVLERKREKARKSMLRALDSRRYERFVNSCSEFLQRGPSRRSKAARRPVLDAGPEILGRRHHKVKKAGDRISKDSTPEEYHELRKKGKRLRYALEFHSEIYGKPEQDLAKSLKSLQDVLGDHQDAEVAIAQLRELAPPADGRRRRAGLSPRSLLVMGGIVHRYELRAAELRKLFPDSYSKVKGKPWKQLRKKMDGMRPPEGTA